MWFVQHTIQRAAKSIPGTFKSVAHQYIFWAILFEAFLQLNQRILSALDPMGGNELLVISLKMNQVFVGFLWTGITIFLIPAAYLRTKYKIDFRLGPFISHQVWPLTVESLRTIGSVLLWAALFIVPGVVQMVRLQLVPFVVMFLKPYESGQIDALETSRQMTRGYFLGLVLLFLLIGLPLILSQYWHGQQNILIDPAVSLISWVVSLTFDFFSNLTLIASFELLLVAYFRNSSGPRPAYFISTLNEEYPVELMKTPGPVH